MLTLLFAADALMPRPPANENIGSGPKLPRILIHSERKGPEAVVIDCPVGNSILLATDIESGDAPALCERFVA